MIIGLFRALYFFGPIIALAHIFMPGRSRTAWMLWAVAAIIVAIHWISFFSAQEDNATEVSIFGVATWTPLLVTTALAALSEAKWRRWHPNPFISQGMIAALCIAPSIAVQFFI
jgi:hypothetical protein